MLWGRWWSLPGTGCRQWFATLGSGVRRGVSTMEASWLVLMAPPQKTGLEQWMWYRVSAVPIDSLLALWSYCCERVAWVLCWCWHPWKCGIGHCRGACRGDVVCSLVGAKGISVDCLSMRYPVGGAVWWLGGGCLRCSRNEEEQVDLWSCCCLLLPAVERLCGSVAWCSI